MERCWRKGIVSLKSSLSRKTTTREEMHKKTKSKIPKLVTSKRKMDWIKDKDWKPHQQWSFIFITWIISTAKTISCWLFFGFYCHCHLSCGQIYIQWHNHSAIDGLFFDLFFNIKTKQSLGFFSVYAWYRQLLSFNVLVWL